MTEPNKQLTIPFSLLRIKTEQFAAFDIESTKLDSTALEAAIRFGIDRSNRLVGVYTKITFLQEEKPFLLVEVRCDFQIEASAWQNLIKDSGQIVLPLALAQHLGVLSIGTTRGVLHAKTEGSPFNNYLIPTLDVTQLVKSDVFFDAV